MGQLGNKTPNLHRLNSDFSDNFVLLALKTIHILRHGKKNLSKGFS
jgi:hypothetical protein